MANCIHLHPLDNVLVALEPLQTGQQAKTIDGLMLCVTQPVPFAHKLALRPILKGATVTKYGEPIGVTSEDIAPGDHVHIHNIRSLRIAGEV